MARKLFERQAIRRRNGQLANGVVMVVYTDEAGLVPADISATLGGSAIGGSQVTTADITGLGPASLRFYGPPDGTDTLYIRVPSDASLGVQKIEADPDPRLDALESGSVSGIPANLFDVKGDLIAATAADTAARLAAGAAGYGLVTDPAATTGLKWVAPPFLNVKNPPFNAAGDGTTDDTAAIAAALAASDLTGAYDATVYFPPGNYLAHELDWSPATSRKPLLVGSEIGNTTITYNGAGGAGTYLFRNNTSGAGFTPWGGIMNMQLIGLSPAAARCANLLLFSGATVGVDFGFKVENCAFVGCSGDALDFGTGPIANLHISRVRFDSIGGWAIRLRSSSDNEHRPVTLSKFTIDNAANTGLGLLRVDDGQGLYIYLEHGRLEGNIAMGTHNTKKQWIYSENDLAASYGPYFNCRNLLGFSQAGDSAKLIRDTNGTARAVFEACNLDNVALFESDLVPSDNIAGPSPQDLWIRGTRGLGFQTGDGWRVGNYAGTLASPSGVGVFGNSEFENNLAIGQYLFMLNQEIRFGLTSDVNLYRGGADVLATADDFAMVTAGKGLKVKEGTNAKMGVATLVAGAATVATTAVTANSRIQLTSQADGGTPGFLRVSTRTAGTSFVITSSSGADTSTVAWLILEPA